MLYFGGGFIAAYVMYRYYQTNYAVVADYTNADLNALITTDTMTDYTNTSGLPLGLTNNNPGNIRYTSNNNWHGQTGSNGGFSVFDNLVNGIRASVINISNLIKTYGTLRKYINAYAPPGDNNNTSAYINYVSSQTGIDPDSVPPLDHDTLKALAMAHFQMENGINIANQYISDADLEKGINLTPYGNSIV